MPEPERASHATEPSAVAPSIPLRTRVAIGAVILAVAGLSLTVFYSRGLSNIYGDSIAHMEGARRFFDSRTPGYDEMGSVWLPLYHLIVAPLSINDFLWRTGLGGSLVSTAAFALAAWVLFRLGLEMHRSAAAGIVALAGFLLCPNMLYTASTALTEPLAILWMVLTVEALFRYQQTGRVRTLVGAAGAAFLGTLTRYTTWFVLPFAAVFVLAARRQPWGKRLRDAVLFSLVSGLGPLLWLAHNAYRFGNALEFYNGPHSAQAIYAHQVATTAFRYPTEGSIVLSARYLAADLELVMGAWPLAVAFLGLIAWAADRGERARRSAALLFLVPFPFYINSLAYGSVPLYVPNLFPNTYYNLRYGLELIPAIALLPSFLVAAGLPRRFQQGILALLLVAIGGQAVAKLSEGLTELVVVKEGILNTPCRSPRQQVVIGFMRENYDGRIVLAAAGKWPCVIPQAGIYIRNMITENNRDDWKRVRSEPAKWVTWIIRGDGDTVDALMRAYPQAFRDFEPVMQERFPREGGVAIYRRRAP